MGIIGFIIAWCSTHVYTESCLNIILVNLSILSLNNIAWLWTSIGEIKRCIYTEINDGNPILIN